MPHGDSLIFTLVGAFVLAFLFGLAALRLKLSPLVGYLLAGVTMGPFTPGLLADGHLASQLAEIGVILLMFGVGLHFSPKDLLATMYHLLGVDPYTRVPDRAGRPIGLVPDEAQIVPEMLA